MPAARIVGSNLDLTWAPPVIGPRPASYLLDAGSAPGASNIGSFPVAATAFSVAGVPPGTYYVRLRAAGPGGAGAPSTEVAFTVGAAGPPSAPVQLAATAPGGVVSLSWFTTTGGGVPTGHALDVGAGPGLANLASIPIGAAPSLTVPGVPAGTYYLRVRALNASGPSAASGELVLIVP